MFQGIGAVQNKESPVVTRLRLALEAWRKSPDDAPTLQRLYAATLLWAAQTKPRWTPADRSLAAALTKWSQNPSDVATQRALALNAGYWTASKHAVGGVGEYFAPAGVGEYFAPSGMGEYFSGIGAEAAVVPEGCDALCSEKMRPMMIAVGAVSLGVGLAVATYAFR